MYNFLYTNVDFTFFVSVLSFFYKSVTLNDILVYNMKQGDTMENLNNDFALKLADIHTVNPFTCNQNTPYYEPITLDYILLFVQQGSLNIEFSSTQYKLTAKQIILIIPNTPVKFMAIEENTLLLRVHFKSTSDNIKKITATPYSAETFDIQLFQTMAFQTDKINFIKKSKPSIMYDREIGSLFTLANTSLEGALSQLLYNLFEKQLYKLLPDEFLSQRENFFKNNKLRVNYYSLSTIEKNQLTQVVYQNSLINQITEFMQINLDKTYSIEDLAQEFLIGSANLKKIFKKETGYSIMHYFKMLKMQQAQIWITEHDLSYTEIADQLGFNSIHHFSAAFKNYFGCSPSKYYDSINPAHHD